MGLDVIFVHESKHIEPSCPIHLMPMGFVSMANWLDEHGVRVEIIHHAIEKRLDPEFDVVDAVRRSGAKLVAMDLHWHATSRAVIELARRIKAALPEVKTVIGGYTASSFTPEILQTFPEIDFVIRGDGEMALLNLARHFTEGASLDEVPNLCRLVNGAYTVSQIHHVNSDEDLGRYTYCRFDLLRHAEYYNQRGVMEGEIRLDRRDAGIFYCNAGRGCPYNCTFCGGGAKAQQFISGRKSVSWRPIPAMMRDLLRMPEYGLDTWYNTFQPTKTEDWFLELFAEIRRAGLRIKMVQECLHIPSKRWVDAFAETFQPGSRIDFVVYTGSDELRKRNKSNYFSAQQVMDAIDLLEPHGIRTDLCMLTGLPFEELEHFGEHFAFIETVRKKYQYVQVNAEILAIEPRAVMNLDPEGNAVTSHATRFIDFYEQHQHPVFIGFTPGKYSARIAQGLAAYSRAAHACRKDVCLFTQALTEDATRLTSVPVKDWKHFCAGCDRWKNCFERPIFQELDLYPADAPAEPRAPRSLPLVGTAK